MAGKCVRQYDLDGRLIAEYRTIFEAAVTNDISSSTITESCKRVGYYKPRGGFIWRYADNDELEVGVSIEVLAPYTQKYRQYSLDGKLVDTFPTATDASRATGIARSMIVECCQRHKSNHTAGGFIWRYYGDDEIRETGRVCESFNPSRIAVLQISVKGEVLARFESIAEASTKLCISRQGISACLSGKQQLSGGYRWARA